MPQFGWNNRPPGLRRQVTALVTDLATTLGDELLGVYLHGSLAMGCFNPQRSDVDILVATRGRLPALARPRLARLLLKLSGGPAPIELSVVNAAGLHPWRHPAPYEFHYSEDWRDRTQAHLLNNTWPEAESEPTDPDLAAHVAVTLARGLSLWGPPAAEVFPAVPASDYIASILADFHWGRDTLGVNPVYFVLNACRVRAFLAEGTYLSKDEGGEWGLRSLPEAHQPIIRQALRAYRGELASDYWNHAALEAFAAAMASEIEGRQGP